MTLFEVTLTADTRMFEKKGNALLKTDRFRRKGEKILIVEVMKCAWDEGQHSAGQFFHQGEPYWLLMSEVEHPTDKRSRLIN